MSKFHSRKLNVISWKSPSLLVSDSNWSKHFWFWILLANQPVTDVIELGGRYHNRNCDVAQNVAIVVPYRNRAEHLKIFVHYMHLYLVNQNAINYQLFIVEQNDSLPFNRGNLLNIGFHEAQRIDPSFNCFIFHDVDILPSNLKQLYTCSDIPRHMCPYLDKFRYVLSYPNLFGGVISIKPEHFVQANGYSNAYSGWGGEDDDFYKRIRNHFPYIERYSPNISKCTMLRHGHLKANSDRHSLLKDALQRSHHEGLTTLNQTYILNSVEYNPLYVKLKIHLL